MKSFSTLLSFFSLIAALCFISMAGISSAQSPGGIDSLSQTGGGAVLACTGYNGRIEVTVSYADGVDYDSGASEYVWMSHAGGGSNISMNQANGPLTTTFQYLVSNGTSNSTALDGSPFREVDGNWVSLAYEFHKQWNGSPEDNTTLIDAKRIAFNCSTGELDSDFDKVFDGADICPNDYNPDQNNVPCAGGIDSLSQTGGGAVLACTGYNGRIEVTVSYADGVDYDSGASEYVWMSHAGGGSNISMNQANGPLTTTFQYLVSNGTSNSTALDGSPFREVDGNWVSLAYEFHKQWNGSPEDNTTLIDAKRIAFNCSTGELDSDFDKAFDGADNCPSVANADQANLDGDSEGDACDTDDDGDGIADSTDNCPSVANADQADADGDDQGDACDSSPNPEEPTPGSAERGGSDEQGNETDETGGTDDNETGGTDDNETDNSESDNNETDGDESDDDEPAEEPFTTDDESDTSENSGSDEQASEDSGENNESSQTRSSDSDVSEDGGDAASKTDSGDYTINTRKEVGSKSSGGGPNTVLIVILCVLGAALLLALGFFANRRKNAEESAGIDEPDQKLEDSEPANEDKDLND